MAEFVELKNTSATKRKMLIIEITFGKTNSNQQSNDPTELGGLCLWNHYKTVK